jgi:ABC-type dipeptide/oligopeptide/nickel transport system permease component
VGTASLVFGLILIGVGIYILLIVKTYSDVDLVWDMFVRLVIALPSFVIGGLLLRKYDKDRKKEKK